jgi:PAS domain S-box-containing protein
MMATPTPPTHTETLRRRVRDVIALSTLSAAWSRTDSPEIADSLADILDRMLSVDFLYVRVNGADGRPMYETVSRHSGTKDARALQKVAESLAPWLRQSAATPSTIAHPLGDGEVHLAIAPLGVDGECGLLAAGSTNPGFPGEEDRLLLGVAANQAATVLLQRRAEAALRESEGRYRHLAELLPVAVYTCESPTGVITYYNAQAARLWGRAPKPGDSDERFCGSFRLYLPDGTHLPHRECPMAVTLDTGREFRNQEVIIERPDGTRMTILVNIDPIRDGGGRVIGAVNVFHDVSPLKHAETRLREQKENLQTLLDVLPVPVFIAEDPACRQISGNRAAAQLLRMRGDGNFSKTSPDDSPMHFLVLDKEGTELAPGELPMQRAARGELIHGEEVTHRFEDGSVVHALVSAQPLLDPMGRPRGMVAGMLDITRLRDVETALRDADRRKDEFLATLAHELRNPLAPIRNALELLHHANGDAALTARSLGIMERQFEQLMRLVDDLLDISRITRGRLQLRPEPVNLEPIVQDALETARSAIETQGHKLTLAMPPEPVRLHADPIRLTQIFANLLTNAAKYTEKSGRIWLTARPEGHEVVISVRDTGVGIAPEQLSGLFHMFSQVRSAGCSPEGLGIGLWLVRALVELHGGRVEARSEGIGRGSEFLVRLPLDTSAPLAPTLANAGGEQRAPSRTRRILVIDDNRDAAECLTLSLRLRGHETAIAFDGPEGVRTADAFRPDVVLLDIGMPHWNGYETAALLRQRPGGENLVIIALTGWGQEADKRRAMEAGFDHHLTKPAGSEELERILSQQDRVPSNTGSSTQVPSGP